MLHRAIVALPPLLCPAQDRYAERIVFFDAPMSTASAHIEQLLMLAWNLSAADAPEKQPYIYKVKSHGELLAGAVGESGDERLLEIGWGPGEIMYASADVVDLFCRPRERQQLVQALEYIASRKRVPA